MQTLFRFSKFNFVFIALLFFYYLDVFSAEFQLINAEFSGIDYSFARTKPCVTDFDRDGRIDLLIGWLDTHKIAHWEQSSSTSTSFSQRTPQFNGIQHNYNPTPCVTDIDGDGLMDLLVGYGEGGIEGHIARYEQTSTNSTDFTLRQSQFDNITVGFSPAPYVTDLDNDDKLDLLIGTSDGNIVRYEQIVENSVDFSLVTSNFNSIDVGSFATPFVSDYNDDGLLDLFVGEEDGNINHYIQNSVNSTSFTRSTTTFSGISVALNSAPCMTDINKDNYPDLLVGKYRDHIEHWAIIPPSVSTDDITDIDHNSCSSGVTVDAEIDIVSAGVCWSTSQNPTIDDPHTDDGSSTGHFNSNITGLAPNTTYYVRGYSEDNYSIRYGYQKSFTTQSFNPEVIPGYALDLDGGEYVEMAYSYEMNPEEFTVSFWVRAEDGQGTFRALVTSRSVTKGYMFYASDDDHWEFWTRDGTSTSNKVEGPEIVLNEWVHIAGTYDGTDMCFYVNGELSGTLSSVSFTPNSYYPLRIGAGNTEGTADYFFNGKIDEVRIWNKARTADEIREDMHIALLGSESNLVSYWQFNEGTGIVLSDNIENNSGQLLNTEEADWLISDIPFGPGYSNMKIIDATGLVNFETTDLTMDVSSKTGVDTIVVNKIEFPPNIEPAIDDSVFNSQYWVINKYGNGSITADISCILNENIVEEDVNLQNSIRLHSRNSTSSDSNWTYICNAGIVNDETNTVTFSGILNFGQMIISRYVLGIPQNVTSVIDGNNLTLTWDAVPNKTFYKIYASDDPYGNYILVGAEIGESWTTPYSESKKFYYVIAINDAK